jgi:hypothetical protein
MRKHLTVELDAGRRCIVRELRVRDMRQILTILTPEQLARPVPEILRSHLPDLLTLLDDCLQLPDGETLEDLSISECEAIGKTWWELHRAFFLQAVGLIGARTNPMPLSASSTAPV